MRRLLLSWASPSTRSGITSAISSKSWAYRVEWNWFSAHSARYKHFLQFQRADIGASPSNIVNPSKAFCTRDRYPLHKLTRGGMPEAPSNDAATAEKCSRQRQQVCSCCLALHRDVNAARNIFALARTGPAEPNVGVNSHLLRSRHL
jgi:hypothetical protein